MRRPPSYSEGSIHLPKSLTKSMPSHTALPLLQESAHTGAPITPPASNSSDEVVFPSVPSPVEMKPLELESPANTAQLIRPPHPALTWATQFTMHLMLISLFETLFFWLFVSRSEDTALTSLVNNYVGGILNSCANMTQAQRTVLVDVFNALVNVTAVNQEGAAAAQGRATSNNVLVRNSWLYFGGLSTLLTVLAGVSAVTRRPLPWRHMTVENLGMVILLGLYEWMFFRTIVYQ